MKLHFIEAPKDGPLRKQIGMADGVDRSFPNAYYLSSYEYDVTVDAEGLRLYRDLLAEQASKGRALMKGLFPRELVSESRKGLIKNEGKTRLVVLDVDGIAMDDVKIEAGKANSDDVKRVAEQVIKLLPADLQDVSYVALASSSFGTQATKVSIHIHMFLDTPVDITILGQWLRSLNFTQPKIYEKLTLTKQKLGVKSIVDECLAQQSRIVYIAPPFFGAKMDDPFADPNERIVLVEKQKAVLQLEPLFAAMDELHSWIDEQETAKREELQQKLGVSTRQRKMKKLYLNGEKAWVVEDPEPSVLTYHSENDKVVAYNRPGDKSGPYFVWKNNPEILYSLKPSELPEMFSRVDPQAYERHVSKYGTGHTEQVVHGKKRRLQHHMFIDQLTDKYHIMSHDPDEDIIVELHGKTVQTAEEFLRYKNALVPDPVPTWYIEFDPSDTRSLIRDQDKTIVNKFIPSEYMLEERTNELAGLITYGHAHTLAQYCPTIFTIIHHMLGNDDEAYEHFVNWFAFIYQTRQKSGKAWLVHGTNGTGKGLFFNRIVTKLFTEHHCKQQTLPEIIDDQFNGWMENCIFLMVDEFNLENAAKSIVASANEFKRMITEPTFSMRKMRTDRITRRQYMNVLLGSNDVGALAMEDKRRVNVAPRQHIMLDAVFPDIEDLEYFDPMVDAELSEFSAYLKGFKVSVKQARSLLKNEAKVQASEAGLNAADRFFKALKEGDFSVFMEVLDTPEDLSNGIERLATLKHFKKLLRESLPHVNTGNAICIHKDDLCRMYSYLSGKVISANAFGRMLNKQEMVMRRVNNPIGYDTALTTRPWCVEVQWHLEDEVLLYELVKAHVHAPTQNKTRTHNNANLAIVTDTM